MYYYFKIYSSQVTCKRKLSAGLRDPDHIDFQGLAVESSSCTCFCKASPGCENTGSSNYKLTFGKGTLLTVNPSKFKRSRGVGDSDTFSDLNGLPTPKNVSV